MKSLVRPPGLSSTPVMLWLNGGAILTEMACGYTCEHPLLFSLLYVLTSRSVVKHDMVTNKFTHSHFVCVCGG